MNKKHVQEGHEQVQQALLDYSLAMYPTIPVRTFKLTKLNAKMKGKMDVDKNECSQDKFNKLLAVLPEIHVVASRGEDHLYQKHVNGGAPTQTLLMEMLHAKRK